jgi:hypothetical protein
VQMRRPAEDPRPCRAYEHFLEHAGYDVHHSTLRSQRGQPQPPQQGRDQRAAGSFHSAVMCCTAPTCTSRHLPTAPAAGACFKLMQQPAIVAGTYLFLLPASSVNPGRSTPTWHDSQSATSLVCSCPSGAAEQHFIGACKFISHLEMQPVQEHNDAHVRAVHGKNA